MSAAIERRPPALAEIEADLPGLTRRWRQDLVKGAIEIGELLIGAKEQVPHGEWAPWLRKHFPDSERTARRFMQLAREVKPANLADLPETIDGTLGLLAPPKEPPATNLLGEPVRDNGDDWRDRLRVEEGVAEPTPSVADPVPESDDRADADVLADNEGEAVDVPPPTDERVANKLAATAKADPDRAREVWREAYERHGESATVEQVTAIADELSVRGEVLDDPLGEARKRYSTAQSRAFRDNDAGAARQALAVWRQEIKPALERVARDGVEIDRSRWRR